MQEHTPLSSLCLNLYPQLLSKNWQNPSMCLCGSIYASLCCLHHACDCACMHNRACISSACSEQPVKLMCCNITAQHTVRGLLNGSYIKPLVEANTYSTHTPAGSSGMEQQLCKSTCELWWNISHLMFLLVKLPQEINPAVNQTLPSVSQSVNFIKIWYMNEPSLISSLIQNWILTLWIASCFSDSGSTFCKWKHVNMRLLNQTHAGFPLMLIQQATHHLVYWLEVSTSLALCWQGVMVTQNAR